MSAYSDLILGHAALRAYYRFGEASGTTLDDVGPNNVDGTYAGSGITLGAAGAIANDADTAVTFDGTSDPATVPDNNALDLGDGPFSIELWLQRSATQDATQTLFTKGGTGYLCQFTTTNQLRFSKSGGSVIASAPAITDQLYHHVVITKDGAATVVYVDGADVTIAGTAQTLADTVQLLRIGFGSAGATRFPGTLDELAFYGAVLTPAEVLQHWQAGQAVVLPSAGGGVPDDFAVLRARHELERRRRDEEELLLLVAAFDA